MLLIQITACRAANSNGISNPFHGIFSFLVAALFGLLTRNKLNLLVSSYKKIVYLDLETVCIDLSLSLCSMIVNRLNGNFQFQLSILWNCEIGFFLRCKGLRSPISSLCYTPMKSASNLCFTRLYTARNQLTLLSWIQISRYLCVVELKRTQSNWKAKITHCSMSPPDSNKFWLLIQIG